MDLPYQLGLQNEKECTRAYVSYGRSMSVVRDTQFIHVRGSEAVSDKFEGKDTENRHHSWMSEHER
jgi:hypothetical protein